MKKIFFLVLILCLAILIFYFFNEGKTQKIVPDIVNNTLDYSASLPEEKTEEVLLLNNEIKKETPESVILPVSYMSEAPDGIWVGNWKNACEEDSVYMVDAYYRGLKILSINEAKAFMQNLFSVQDALYGDNKNSSAERTVYLINTHSTFKGKVKENPTIDEIKEEIRQGRPVISMHYGFDLKNENIPFRIGGTSYHVLVIVGFDDATEEFITNDPGDTVQGHYRAYKYNLFMHSIKDFDHISNQADGPPRVVFTSK